MKQPPLKSESTTAENDYFWMKQPQLKTGSNLKSAAENVGEVAGVIWNSRDPMSPTTKHEATEAIAEMNHSRAMGAQNGFDKLPQRLQR